MSNNFNKFAAEIRNRGVAKQSHFIVDIKPPPGLTDSLTKSIAPVVPLLCEQTNFPETTLDTSMIKDGGLNREVVIDKRYGQINLTFVCDQQMLVKYFFDQWIRLAVVDNGGLFAYPETYTSPELYCYQVDAQKNIVYINRMTNVYPKIVNDLIGHAGSRDYQRFQVIFAFEKTETFVASTDLVVDPKKPEKALDIARILHYAGGLSRQGARSAILSAGTDAITKILSGTKSVGGAVADIPKTFGIGI